MPSKASFEPDWPPLIRRLHDARCYPHTVDKVRSIETHISWVLLTGRIAYKIKKPVKFSFLDFSTLELRRKFCFEELAINKRLAEDLYLDVVPIGGSPQAPVVGQSPALEFAVRMRQFDQTDRLDSLVRNGVVTEREIRDFATRIAEFHRREQAETDVEPGLNEAGANIAELRGSLDEGAFRAKLDVLERWTVERSAELAPDVGARIAAGFYRDCHGDLHLENVVRLDEHLTAFDALEFDRRKRVIDPVDEIAFLAMDLLAHDRSDLAFVFLTAYLELSGDYAGTGLLRYYIVYRALIRAKVAALKRAAEIQPEQYVPVEDYIDLALSTTKPERPLIVITHGLSGSGKTYLTGRLVGLLEALRVRTDLERKRLMKLSPLESSASPIGGGAYDADISARTYRVLRSAASRAVLNGFNCIMDGTFLRHAERAAVRGLCKQSEARFVILDCFAPDETIRQRLRERAIRRRDASEADTAVLDYQLAEEEPLTADEQALSVKVDTTAAVDLAGLVERLLRTAAQS